MIDNNGVPDSIYKIFMLTLILLICGILVLLFSGYIFALFFDREDLVFGFLLHSDAAGISLILKAAIAGILLTLLIHYPKHDTWCIRIALVFSGYLLADSFVTTHMVNTGYQYFSMVLGFFFLLSIGLFVIHHIKRSRTSS